MKKIHFLTMNLLHKFYVGECLENMASSWDKPVSIHVDKVKIRALENKVDLHNLAQDKTKWNSIFLFT